MAGMTALQDRWPAGTFRPQEASFCICPLSTSLASGHIMSTLFDKHGVMDNYQPFLRRGLNSA
eukprot:1370399-Karenia_brevis.AAC.1